MRSLTIDPQVPGALWATLAVLGVGAIAFYLLVHPPRISRRRRIAVAALLAASLAAMLALLLNPTWEELEAADLGRPVLNVLIDTSASMGTRDVGDATRLEAAQRTALELQDELAGQFDVRLWAFDTALRPLAAGGRDSLMAEGIATDLGRCVAGALASDLSEEEGIVLLSDGIHNVRDTLPEVQKAARTARAMAVPIFTRTLGADAAVADLRLRLITPDDLAFIRQKVPVRVLLEHPGLTAGSAEVSMTSESGVEAVRTVSFRSGEPVRVEFPVSRDEPGLYRYVVSATPLPSEVVRANNQAVFHLRVIDEPIRVLVLEGKPYWDFKFLVRQLAMDPGVRVSGAVQVSPGRVILRRTASEPPGGTEGSERPAEQVQVLGSGAPLLESYEALKEYHVVMLGREAQAFLTPEAVGSLCRWVSEWGGSVVCTRGRPVQMVPERLDALMPVRWQAGSERRFHVRMTREGEWAGWLPREAAFMTTLATGARVEEVKPLASVLARADDAGGAPGMAAVSTQRYGSGRVVVVEGSGQWRWALGSVGLENAQEDLYRSFWNNMVRWLAGSAEFLPGQDASLRATQRAYTVLDRVHLQLVVRAGSELAQQGAAVIELKGPSGEELQLQAMPEGGSEGVFAASGGPLPQGTYVARLAGRGAEEPVQCAFEVTQPMEERLDLQARPALMRMLAEESGAEVLGDRPAGQIRNAYVEQWRERHPDQFHRTPLWDRLPFMLGLVALMGAAWLVRRRGGLI